MLLDRVTVTGADDSVDPGRLLLLSEEYPFVEWGILLSSSQEGSSRFPSLKWLKRLHDFTVRKKSSASFAFSGHLCGSWVRKLCMGDIEFFRTRSEIVPMFKRLQINFHAITHTVDKEPFIKALKLFPGQFIFQLDDVNNSILDIARAEGIDAVPLFDLSGGAGVLPSEWPVARDCYSGYAGGLSPENVDGQLKLIEKVCGEKPIWIDVETLIRSSNDRIFDLVKVRNFLEATKSWVKNG